MTSSNPKSNLDQSEASSDSESDFEKSKKSRKSNRSSKKSTPIKKGSNKESPLKKRSNRSSRNRSRSRSESRNNRNFGRGDNHVTSGRTSRNVSGPWSRTINQNSLSRSRSRDPPVRSRGRHPLDRSRYQITLSWWHHITLLSDHVTNQGQMDQKIGSRAFFISHVTQKDANGPETNANSVTIKMTMIIGKNQVMTHTGINWLIWLIIGRSLPNTGLIDRTEPLRQNRRSYTPDKRRY